ncbi:MAG: cyclic nucleotide-binding domain-containing protein [Rhodoferax sp.]
MKESTPGGHSTPRLKLLAGVAGLSELPEPALQALADSMQEERHACGALVVAEGEVGERFYVVAQGEAEVSARKVPLGSLHAQDVFGEIALLSPDARRTATVRSRSELVLLSLSAEAFKKLLQDHPALKELLQSSARRLLRLRFLRLSTPFSDGSQGALLRLAEHAQDLHLAAGDTVIRAGEAGDTAYCLVSGRLQVLREGQPPVPLEPGALFGEAALLTGDPRNATVQALEASELMVLHRATVLAAMGEDPRVASACLSMLRLRERPRRKRGIEVFESQSADGTPFTVLKDPEQGRYFRLSAEGRFVWERLDGARDLRALAIEFFLSFQRFAPDMVAAIVQTLALAGFVEVRSLAPDVHALTRGPAAWWQPMAHAVRAALNWQMALNHCDPWISRWYGAGMHRLFTPLCLAAMAVLSLAGMAVFAWYAAPALRALSAPGALPAMVWLLPAGLFALLAHEAGHALTVKACGRRVERVGLGWYGVTPVLFVDTSDMWLAGKWQRIGVGLAGMGANLLLAGCAALLAPLLDAQAGAAAWLFAALSYVAVFLNLNPLLDYDGYHVLSDWLERPNLRQDALARLWRAPGRGYARVLAGSPMELLYAAWAATYVLLLGLLVWALPAVL